MKNVIIIAAACLLTASVTLAIISVGLHLKDSGGKIPDLASALDMTAVLAETIPEGDMEGNQVEVSGVKTDVARSENIIIPGFTKSIFKAGKKKQDILLYNPKENSCYFMISILLADSTELYQSELLAPGDSLTTIKLTHVPDPGIYEDTILRYSCYDMNTLKGMNGANTKFILEVIE